MSDNAGSPVGSWTGTVTHDGEVDEYTVDFAADGTLEMVTAVSKGVGGWKSIGPDTFSFECKEIFNEDAGMPPAYIQIELEAKLTDVGFTGFGKATIYSDLDDRLIYYTNADTVARRAAAA